MRKKKPKKRYIAPDPRFNDPLVMQFINNLMWEGKKTVAMKIYYDAMDIVEKRNEEHPHEVFKKALVNATPHLEVRSKRIGGATFQIPTEIPAKRRVSIGMKWLIKYARSRGGKGMAEKLAAEILAAFNNEGGACKRKDEMHRMAEANRAFAHFKV